jgi:hypothetical protein
MGWWSVLGPVRHWGHQDFMRGKHHFLINTSPRGWPTGGLQVRFGKYKGLEALSSEPLCLPIKTSPCQTTGLAASGRLSGGASGVSFLARAPLYRFFGRKMGTGNRESHQVLCLPSIWSQNEFIPGFPGSSGSGVIQCYSEPPFHTHRGSG